LHNGHAIGNSMTIIFFCYCAMLRNTFVVIGLHKTLTHLSNRPILQKFQVKFIELASCDFRRKRRYSQEIAKIFRSTSLTLHGATSAGKRCSLEIAVLNKDTHMREVNYVPVKIWQLISVLGPLPPFQEQNWDDVRSILDSHI